MSLYSKSASRMEQASSRWFPISATSPSGKTLFVCRSCGRTSDVPEDDCPRPVRAVVGSTAIFMPCKAWPLEPAEWLRKSLVDSHSTCLFTGTVTFKDGTVVEVTLPLPEEKAEEFVVLQTELKLMRDRQKEAEKEAEKERARIEKEQQDVLKQLVNTNQQTEQQRKMLETIRSNQGLLGKLGASSKELGALVGIGSAGILGKCDH